MTPLRVPFVLMLVVACSHITLAQQQRYLVTPNGDAVPLSKGESAAQRMKQLRLLPSSTTQACSNQATFGITPDVYPISGGHVSYHKDIFAEWFVAPAAGTIDSVFFYMSNPVTVDSVVKVRLLQSRISTGVGPGYGPYSSTKWPSCWGYFFNTNDIDNGIAAFPEDATPPDSTAWVSLIDSSDPGAPATKPNAGAEIWGLGGFPKNIRTDVIEAVSLNDLGYVPTVTVGYPFFISLQVPGVGPSSSTDSTATVLERNDVSDPSNYKKCQLWKFYEFRGTCNLPGWTARGYFNDLIWYEMSVTTNVPPVIKTTEGGDIHTTLSTLSQHVRYSITDCNPAHPESAGVASAQVTWSLQLPGKDSLAPQAPIAMTNTGGAIWEADIPGEPAGSKVSYQVTASDAEALSALGPPLVYSVVTLVNPYYFVDTSYACVQHDIRATGTTIDTLAFFEPHYSGSGTSPYDDGTAGPFDIGGQMPLFGDSARYAWVGINGGIALSKSPTDTLDVNSNGFYATFSFPGGIKGPRPDSARKGNMPGNFIAPFWADLILHDQTGTFGRIVHQAEPCLFTVEWDSIGAFATTGSQADNTTFRVVLNKCDGTIEYQYTSVGTLGEDSACVVGLQADSTAITKSNSVAVFINSDVYPLETKPRDNWCIKLYPGNAVYANAGWNMVSLGTRPPDDHKAAAYPLGISSAFAYQGGYVVTDPLSNGPGYWLKFADYSYAGAPGFLLDSVQIPITKGWNMIGSTSHPVPTSAVVKSPAGAHLGNYFGYGGSGYTIVSTIRPGYGYWVKSDSNGSLKLPPPSSAMPKTDAQPTDLTQLNSVTITDRNGRSQTLYLGDASLVREPAEAFAMPPAAPEFDVRFSDGRILETYASTPESKVSASYPITITTDAYPVTIKWTAMHAGAQKLVLNQGAKLLAVMEGTGSVRISNSAMKTVTVALGGTQTVPIAFALSQNYPNPFNPSTHFTVDVPHSTDVEVAIYDVLGQKVTSLVTGEVGAGSYQVTWDGRDSRGLTAPTGIYFVRMTADEFSAVRKIMMMK